MSAFAFTCTGHASHNSALMYCVTCTICTYRCNTCTCSIHVHVQCMYMFSAQKMISATSRQPWIIMVIVWIPLWSIVKFISLYNEVSRTIDNRIFYYLWSDRVVHFGIQLPVFSRIQAESDKDRIHTLGHAY